MNRQDIKKCVKEGHEYLFYLNVQGNFKAKPRCLQLQKKLVNKILFNTKSIIREISRNGINECIECYQYIKSLNEYLISLDWDLPETRYEVEQLVHNITFTLDRKWIKIRTKFRGDE